MYDQYGEKHTGILKRINQMPVDFRASIVITEKEQTVVTIYELTTEAEKEIRNSKYCCGVIKLDRGGYLNLFDLLVEGGSRKQSRTGEEETEITLRLSTTNTIYGEAEFGVDEGFNELQIEITEGCELIGLCPYDIHKTYEELIEYKGIEMPFNCASIVADTILGEFQFFCIPKVEFDKDELKLKMKHHIDIKLLRKLTVKDLDTVLLKITDFFSILCGELVTINSLSLFKGDEFGDDEYEFIGYSNFVRPCLNLLKGNGLDSTAYLRIGLFKVSDFPDLGKALNWWFENSEKLRQAQNSYGRILLDEEVRIVTENKFLAAMQLVEGYESAANSDDDKKTQFETKKEELITKLEKADQIFAKRYLTYSGETFRKRIRSYMYEGIEKFVDMSKSEFNKKYDKLIGEIVSERDLYTHGSTQVKPQFSLLETARIADICKAFYRANLLNSMGVSKELLRRRFSHNRSFVAYAKSIFGIDIKNVGQLDGFDKAMWHFSTDETFRHK